MRAPARLCRSPYDTYGRVVRELSLALSGWSVHPEAVLAGGPHSYYPPPSLSPGAGGAAPNTVRGHWPTAGGVPRLVIRIPVSGGRWRCSAPSVRSVWWG